MPHDSLSSSRSPLLAFLAIVGMALACAAASGDPSQAAGDSGKGATSAEATGAFRHEPPTELFEVTRVIDGDTIWVRRAGKEEKLRLLAVDTEEKLDVDVGPTKPGTVFGEECALWAQEFFRAQGREGAPARVGLAFPGGREARDVYGRLLCNVVLEDGTDFNLLLVELGKSPYFNKYGNSEIGHEHFVRAQAEARRAKRGIWNPETNVAKSPGAPSARRDYERLLPWWQMRADAIEGFRRAAAKSPEKFVASDDPYGLEQAAKRGTEVEVFAALERLFDEDDGTLTCLLRSGDKKRAVRVKVPADKVAEHRERLDFEHLNDEFRQNYFYVRGRLERGSRGFDLVSKDPAQWRLAEPTAAAPIEPAESATGDRSHAGSGGR